MLQYFIYAGAGLGALSFILLIILNFRLNGVMRRYHKLISGLTDKNIEDLMISYSQELGIIKRNISGSIEERLAVLEKKMPECLRKIGIVTYNAFENIGNNMSFSIAALDDREDGFILTGIYSRDHSYVYAKRINGGKPVDKELSKEERDALAKAVAKK
jgi:hypothetical protein